MRLFPLQNALGEVTPEGGLVPAWYSRLCSGDEMSFRLVDISDLAGASCPAYPGLALLEFIFTDPRTGAPRSPFSDPPAAWKISPDCRQELSPVYSRFPGQELPTWDILAVDAVGGEESSVRLAAVPPGDFRTFGLSVVLKMQRDGWTDQFIFDPEMIVGGTDGLPR
jgi:hypothetical protein